MTERRFSSGESLQRELGSCLRGPRSRDIADTIAAIPHIVRYRFREISAPQKWCDTLLSPFTLASLCDTQFCNMARYDLSGPCRVMRAAMRCDVNARCKITRCKRDCVVVCFLSVVFGFLFLLTLQAENVWTFFSPKKPPPFRFLKLASFSIIRDHKFKIAFG